MSFRRNISPTKMGIKATRGLISPKQTKFVISPKKLVIPGKLAHRQSLNTAMKIGMGTYQSPSLITPLPISHLTIMEHALPKLKARLKRLKEDEDEEEPEYKGHRLGIGTLWWLKERGLSIRDPVGVVEFLEKIKFKHWTIFDAMLIDPEIYNSIVNDPAYKNWP